MDRASPLPFCILLVIKNWTVEKPGNEATSSYVRMLSSAWLTAAYCVPPVQAVGKYYAIGTSHGLVLVFGKCLSSVYNIVIVNVFMFTFFSDLKEQLKCVLSPYQKGTSGTDVDGRLKVHQKCGHCALVNSLSKRTCTYIYTCHCYVCRYILYMHVLMYIM